MDWYVLHARPSELTHEGLKRLGFSYHYLTEVRHRPKRGAVSAAVFPGYFFVGWNEGEEWQKLYQVPGARRILGDDAEHPSALPEGAVERLISENVERHEVTTAKWPVGTILRISAGPFAGREVKVMGHRGPSVIVVLETFGGRETLVEIDENSLEL